MPKLAGYKPGAAADHLYSHVGRAFLRMRPRVENEGPGDGHVFLPLQLKYPPGDSHASRQHDLRNLSVL